MILTLLLLSFVALVVLVGAVVVLRHSVAGRTLEHEIADAAERERTAVLSRGVDDDPARPLAA